VIIFSAILQLNPPRVRAHRPEVPQGLDDVIFRCMAKEPPARFQSVLELAVALEPFGPSALGTSKRIHAILSRDGEKLLPLPLAFSNRPSAPSIRTIVWRGRRVASFSRGVRWAVGLGAVASVIVLAILLATAGGDEVPPATAADPAGDASPRGAEPAR